MVSTATSIRHQEAQKWRYGGSANLVEVRTLKGVNHQGKTVQDVMSCFTVPWCLLGYKLANVTNNAVPYCVFFTSSRARTRDTEQRNVRGAEGYSTQPDTAWVHEKLGISRVSLRLNLALNWHSHSQGYLDFGNCCINRLGSLAVLYCKGRDLLVRGKRMDKSLMLEASEV